MEWGVVNWQGEAPVLMPWGGHLVLSDFGVGKPER